MGNIKKFEQFSTTTGIDVIQKLELDEYLRIVLKESSSNEAPYHNINHVLCVVKYSYLIGKDENLKDDELRDIVLSALFHDFNHSQGKYSDDKNIEFAIKAVKKYLGDENVDAIVNIIRATQYPYIIPDEELTLSQEIIRDCDMMQTFEDNYEDQILFGLSKELGMKLTDFIDVQIKFLNNLKFHTSIGKEMAKKQLPKVIDKVKYLKKLLK